MSKKVIEQEKKRPKRKSYPCGIYGDIDYERALEKYCTYLEKRSKAIDPEYQKVENERDALLVDIQNKNQHIDGLVTENIISFLEQDELKDQNAKLVEALRDVELCLESQLYNDEISRGVLSSLLQRVKALQNTKNIEG